MPTVFRYPHLNHRRIQRRNLVEQAQRDGIAHVPEAPDSMRALVDEFEQLPDWVVAEWWRKVPLRR
jgi:hypothetical protein